VDSFLFHVWEDCKYEHNVKGSIADYKLYQMEGIDDKPDNNTSDTAQDDVTPVADGKESIEMVFGEEKSIPTVPADWSCPACTFINIPSAAACDICGLANPVMAAAAGAEEEGEGVFEANAVADDAPANYAVWICSRCTWNNRLQNVK
jgi:hypothetical protein